MISILLMKLNKKNYNEWLLEARKKLTKAGIPSANLDAILLLEHVVKKNIETILTYPETLLDRFQINKLEKLLKKRLRHTPVAYLVNKKEFYGREFYVNNNVLIPRPETESFISLLEKLSFEKKQKLIDLGTGSGILAVTVKSLHPDWDVTATDISKKALKVARYNAKRIGVEINFKKSNLFNSIDNNFDIVIANLPYVPTKLPVLNEVKKEPQVAIFSGKDGLNLYRNLFKSSFKKDSFLFLESLVSQQKNINLLANKNGFKAIAQEGLVSVFKKIK